MAWRSVCVAGWQLKIIVQSVEAKGERVYYLSLLSRQLLPTELISLSAMSVGVNQFQKYLLLPEWESKSFDFVRKDIHTYI